MEIDPRLLPAFVTLADEPHFTRAARALHLSQSTLTRQVRRLEQQLGFELFVRDSHRVELTRAGGEFLPGARRALSVIDEAVARGRATARGEANALKVAVSIVGGLGLTAAITAAFRQARPEVELSYVHGDGVPHVQHTVADGEADVSFAWEPIFREELDFVALRREPLWIGLPAAHPAARLEQIGPEDVRDLPNVGPWSTVPKVVVDRWAGAFGAGRGAPPWGPETTMLADSLLAMAEGRGFFLVNELFSILFPREGIAYRAVIGVEPIEFGVAWRRDDDREGVQAFRDIAAEVAGLQHGRTNYEEATVPDA